MGFHFTMQKVVNTKILKNNTFHQFRHSTTFGVAFHHPSGLTEYANTKNERKGKDKSSKGFLEDHWSYSQVRDDRCFNFEEKDIFYTFLVRGTSTAQSLVLTSWKRDSYQVSTPTLHSWNWHSSAPLLEIAIIRVATACPIEYLRT